MDSSISFPKETDSVLKAVRESWPELNLDDRKFKQYLKQTCVSFNGTCPSELAIPDLALAYACLEGNEQALLLFENEYIPLIRRNISALRLSSSAMEEIVQRVRYKLFVRLKDREPKLSQYNGSSKLGSWLRVVALREALDFVKSKDQKDLPLGDGEIADQIIECDQEILLIKKRYHQAFETILKDALKSLNHTERNLLRASVLDKLTVDDIGKLHQVHRATAARWLASIRLRLKDDIKQRLKSHLLVDTHEYNKIAHVLQSQLDLSLSRILNPAQL